MSKLSEDHIKIISEHVAAKLGNLCLHCKKELTLSDSYFMCPELKLEEESETKTMPFIVLTCSSCYAAVFINPVLLGLIKGTA